MARSLLYCPHEVRRVYSTNGECVPGLLMAEVTFLVFFYAEDEERNLFEDDGF